ncbi:MAG: hypothetical protein WKF79_06265 [Nocardioides sp.]
MSRVDGFDLFAHGLGGGADLPIPPELAIAGGCAALTVSFAVLLVAWRHARFENVEGGRPVPASLAAVLDSTAFAVVVRVLGMLVFLYAAWAAVAGQNTLINPFLGLVYVWLWVGLVPVSLLFGSFFKAVSPARTIHLLVSKLTGGDPDVGLRTYRAGWGYWPAALGLLAFVWLELVYQFPTEIASVRLWFAVYLAAMVIGSAVFGSTWLERADPFEVYSTLVGHLSVWGRNEREELVWRSPLRNLSAIRGEPGLVAVVAILLGSTAYDSFRESIVWVRFTQSYEGDVTVVNTGALLLALLIVGLTFSAATMATGVDRVEGGRRRLPGIFAHSVVPIIVGYMVAHYLTLFVEQGTATLIYASDPLSNGSNLFGTADGEIIYWFSNHPSVLATVKVVAIVTGHVLGVIAAHDKAVQVLPANKHVVGQLPLLFAMVLYTFGGLYLLFGV